MKKHLFLLFCGFIVTNIYSQIPTPVFDKEYVKYTALNMAVYGGYLASHNSFLHKTEKTTQKMMISTAQVFLEKKLYLENLKGVNYVLKTSIVVKRIGENIIKIYTILEKISNKIIKNPKLSFVLTQVNTNVLTLTSGLVNSLNDFTLTKSHSNLIGQLDRFKIAMNINQKVKRVYGSLIVLNAQLDRVIRLGLWNTYNPIEDFIEEDIQTLFEIQNNWKILMKH